MQMLKRILSIIAISALCGNLISCGGGSSDPEPTKDNSSMQPSADDMAGTVLTGVLVDSAVEGVSYSTSTQSGTTNTAGEFNYLEGEQVVFSVGDTILPSVAAAPQVSPVDMASGSSNSAATTTNIARLLQSLDIDGNPDNGITISPIAAANAAPIKFDINVEEFANNTDVLNLVANSGSVNSELISAEEANLHLNATLSTVETPENDIVFSVESLNNRFLIPTPENFAAGANAYRMNADTRLRVAGIVNGELLYGKFPWTVTDEAEFQVDFGDFQDGLVIGYSATSTEGEKITLNVSTVGSIEDGTKREYYLSKTLSTSDFAGRKITIENTTSSVEFVGQSDALFTYEDGRMASGSYEDLTVQGVGFRGPDFFNQVVLANGDLDDGLIMLWRYDVNDSFTNIEFYKSRGPIWTSVGSFSR